jgi:hypothetical protein
MQFIRLNSSWIKRTTNLLLGYISGAYLFTETSDNLVTEGLDRLITE